MARRLRSGMPAGADHAGLGIVVQQAMEVSRSRIRLIATYAVQAGLGYAFQIAVTFVRDFILRVLQNPHARNVDRVQDVAAEHPAWCYAGASALAGRTRWTSVSSRA